LPRRAKNRKERSLTRKQKRSSGAMPNGVLLSIGCQQRRELKRLIERGTTLGG